MIKRVVDEKDAFYCDVLLTKLIQEEIKYDIFIDNDFVVKNYFKNIIKNIEHILLCYIEKNNIIGYIYLKPIRCENKKGYLIDGLYVEEEYRNKGIAKSLISESLKQIANENIKFIDVNVLYNNDIARKLYKFIGFEELKLQMRKDLK